MEYKLRLSMVRTLWIIWIAGLTLLGSQIDAQSSDFTISAKIDGYKVCRGTSWGFHISGSSRQRYEEYKRRYTNCTIVNGNLELVFLEDPPYDQYDLSFLSSVREVTGYVLISNVFVDYVPLTSLTIIRGNSLFQPDTLKTDQLQNKYSLYVALNYKPNSTTIGLKELRFRSLHEITNGDVSIYWNNLLCYENTINWFDIITGEGAQAYENKLKNTGDSFRKCGDCDASCPDTGGHRHCWGSGPDYCQNLTRVVCSLQCEGHCFGPNPSECCHPECIGGCTGPLRTDCLACKHFYDGEKCVSQCPLPNIYDKEKFEYRPNPDVKYAYGSLCVDKCPSFLVTMSAICVKECGAGKIPDEDKVCKLCNGPCPKSCDGLDDFLHAHNIGQFENCTRIKGNIMILMPTFNGDPDRGIPPMDPSQMEIFKTVREITGYLMVQGRHRLFKDLSYFSNLELINGRDLDRQLSSGLQIYNTTLEVLGLMSLKRVENGRIIVTKNSRLCYGNDQATWEELTTSPSQEVIATNNARDELCRRDGAVCHPECSDLGCWGPERTHCLSCKNFQYGDLCLSDCTEIPGLYQVNATTCDTCDVECKSSCKGAGPKNCTMCKNFQDGPKCVAECPEVKYSDDRGYCQPCHENCDGGCTGPHNTVGPSACNSCAIVRMGLNDTFAECFPQNVQYCPFGYYRATYLEKGPMHLKILCHECDDLCRECKGPGDRFCDSCKYFELQGTGEGKRRCVKDCDQWGYWADNRDGTCKICDDQCDSCTGPTSMDCTSCRQYKVYLDGGDDPSPPFNCTNRCPADKPATTAESWEGYTQAVCVTATALRVADSGNLATIVGSVIGGIVVALILLVILVFLWRQRARAKENTLMLTARMSGLEESEPLTPTDVRPDMSLLRLVKESELRKGNIIGSGAFGTVYRGVFIPEGENVKVPVAIKVLQEGTSPSLNKELLEEARVMASVDHPCCVRILAVCMTAQMMLITQLMPLGCLLDYVRKNRSNIGSKALLNWCTQIAKGMNYLEEKGIVHRDLAARNVLVQSAHSVRITDFGLAKLLNYNEEEYRSTGGKMPIKWLALECIQHRIFTHKSDVWSYGVTIWELFTYGQRPYPDMRARDVPDLLEKGERLPQPEICTIDVYMIMIKCWMLDAESRPSFRELADEFAKMARDPGRYVAIEGDKFMRLPSHTYDPKDLLRNMSVPLDGPEVIIEGDDYLQPTSSISELPEENSLPMSNGKYSSGYSTGRSLDYDDDCHSRRHHRPGYNNHAYPPRGRYGMGGERDLVGDYHHGARRHAAGPPPPSGAPGGGPRAYGGLEAAAVARKQRQQQVPRDSVSSRYTADPTKVLDTQGKDEVDAVFPEVDAPPLPAVLAPPGTGNHGNPGDVSKHKDYVAKQQELPSVDEDDYLQPKSSNPAPYMDIIPDTKDYLEPEEHVKESAAPPVGASLGGASTIPDEPYNEIPVNAMDNPEYFDSPPVGGVKKPLLPDPRVPAPNNHSLNNNIDGLKSPKEAAATIVGPATNSPDPADSYVNTDYDHIGNRAEQMPFNSYINPRSESAV